MLLLGIDVGTSSIKVSVVDSDTQRLVASAQYPDTEVPIKSLQPGWAEQSPEEWWQNVKKAIQRATNAQKFNPKDIAAIGIAYQMHGLVTVDKNGQVLRDSIIWCDSRAVPYGDRAFQAIGCDSCLSQLLNSPGNFTAAKLAWVKEQEPQVYERVDKVLLPGDFVALKLTGQITTTPSALSEGIFWNFKKEAVAEEVMDYFGFEEDIIPEVKPVFAEHGRLTKEVADELGLKEGTPVTYKSGDQPNNALSLNVLKPGEVAATAGTSGVIYAVSDELTYDKQSRVNTFAHVNHATGEKRLGILLCINGAGSMNRWAKNIFGADLQYRQMNKEAGNIPIGCEGVRVLPFGNGVERMLNNQLVGAQLHGIDVNRHVQAHLFRAVQEGIAFAFRYGLDIMRENGLQPGVIRAGRANMFLSPVFTQAFVNATGVPVELYASDGSVGAAIGAGIGAKVFKNEEEAFANMKPLERIEPSQAEAYDKVYEDWKTILMKQLRD